MPLYNNYHLDYINLKDFCKIDGSSDDSAGFTTAYALASSLGMSLFHPGGTLIKGNDTLLSGVMIIGAGVGVSTIKLKNGANTDLFSANTSSINLSAGYATGSNTGVNGWGFRDVALDGNKVNQTAGPSWLVRVYGYNILFQNVAIMNGYTGNVQIDWNPTTTPSSSTEIRMVNVRSFGSNGAGIEIGGPSDGQLVNVLCYLNGTNDMHFAPNAGGMQCTNCHCWNTGTGSTIGWLIESNVCMLSNCEGEGEGMFDMVILGNYTNIMGGAIYSGALGSTAGGIQIGQQSGQTPYSGQILQSGGTTTAVAPVSYSINTVFHDINVSTGCVWFANDGGSAQLNAVAHLSTGGVLYSGTPASSTSINASITGITADGTAQKSGGTTLISSSYGALNVGSSTGLAFSVDTFDSPMSLNLYSGALFNMYDNASHNLLTMNAGYLTWGQAYDTNLHRGAAGVLLTDGALATGESTTSPNPGNGGTITTAGIGIAKVTPTAAQTGIILQAGLVGGQEVYVVNQSAFSITFAVAATSHVAQGTSVVIAANGSRLFKWDSTNSLWY